MSEIVYLNHAATTWPKPEPVYDAVNEAIRSFGSCRRGSAVGIDPVDDTREIVAELLGIAQPGRLCFMPGCTFALNTAIQGLDWQPGDVCVMSSLEHHAVSRPVRKIARERGVRFELIPYRQGSPVDLDFLEGVLRQGGVKLVACTMASNVTGEITPIKDVVALAKQHGALTLVDAAQAAGVIPMNVADIGPDMLAFAGHKGLLGPVGVGGLYSVPGITLCGLVEGGTAGDSGTHALTFDRAENFEVGTINAPAIAGLGAGAAHIREQTIEAMHARESALLDRLIRGLLAIEGVRLFGPGPGEKRTSAVTFQVLTWEDQKAASCWLHEQHNIISRAGFHCAPLAHETLGIYPSGAIRFSPGWSTSEAEIDAGLRAVEELAGVGAAV